MRFFVTGASGFIGSAVVAELLGAGHEVLGLARSDAAAKAVEAAGAKVHRGALDDLGSLRAGAKEADGVAHLAFIHDFSNFEASLKAEFAAVGALGEALAPGAPLAIASGIIGIAPGRIALESEPAPQGWPRGPAEEILKQHAKRGVRTAAIRLPPSVHDAGDHGFIHMLGEVAKKHGTAVYLGDGANRWPAVHRKDAARLFRLALEKATPGSTFHAIGDDGIPTKEIATAIGAGLGLPVASKPAEAAAEHFGPFMAWAFGADAPASCTETRRALGWEPKGIGLLEDIRANYFAKAST